MNHADLRGWLDRTISLHKHQTPPSICSAAFGVTCFRAVGSGWLGTPAAACGDETAHADHECPNG